MDSTEQFSSLNIPIMHITGIEVNSYLVYSSKTESSVIEANTAYEAKEKSGIKDPYKIVHVIGTAKKILDNIELAPINVTAENTKNNQL